MNFMIGYLLRRLLPWTGSGAGGRKPETALTRRRAIRRLAFAASAAGILLVAGAIVVWDLGEQEPEPQVLFLSLDPYDTTLYTPIDGHILWKIRFLVCHAEKQPVIIDICDFSAVASDGTEYHFAWRWANLTCMVILEENFTTRLELSGSGICRITAPFELPQSTYPVQIIWRSALGEFLSEDIEEWFERRTAEITARS